MKIGPKIGLGIKNKGFQFPRVFGRISPFCDIHQIKRFGQNYLSKPNIRKQFNLNIWVRNQIFRFFIKLGYQSIGFLLLFMNQISISDINNYLDFTYFVKKKPLKL